MKRLVLAATLAIAPLAMLTAHAQQASPPPITKGNPNVKRTILQRADVPGTNLETIVALVEIAPEVKAGRHSHPGNVFAYVIDGEFNITLDGTTEKVFKVGESLSVAPGAIHDEGTKDKPAKLIATYVLEKGKPLAQPAK